ncbi:MAG: thioesterase family protein [Cyanobacteria bacterium J06638_6]
MEPCHWYEYGVVVQPHHTDFAGIVWHGTYIAWMEEARVAALKACGLTFADWLREGVDLPVVDLALRYRKSFALGDEALVKTCLGMTRGVRLVWHYEIQNVVTQETGLEGKVTLVPVDLKTRRVLRSLPDPLQSALENLRLGPTGCLDC